MRVMLLWETNGLPELTDGLTALTAISHYLVLVPAGHASRYPATAGSCGFQKFKSGKQKLKDIFF